MPREEAERQARVEFGSWTAQRAMRQARGLRLWDETVKPSGMPGACCEKSPGFAVTAVLTWQSALARTPPSSAR